MVSTQEDVESFLIRGCCCCNGVVESEILFLFLSPSIYDSFKDFNFYCIHSPRLSLKIIL